VSSLENCRSAVLPGRDTSTPHANTEGSTRIVSAPLSQSKLDSAGESASSCGLATPPRRLGRGAEGLIPSSTMRYSRSAAPAARPSPSTSAVVRICALRQWLLAADQSPPGDGRWP
jgi:hypothetical protein